MMRVLVTGIEGFVGSHLAEHLLSLQGVELHGTVLDAGAIRNIEHLQPYCHLHQVDITEGDAIRRLVDEVQPDRVLHLAGQAFVPSSLVDPAATFNANIIGGINVLEALRKQPGSTGTPPRILIVSTGEVYGRIDPSQMPLTELTPVNPNNPYAASKASIDFIAQQYRNSFGMNVIVVRPFNHAGPRQNPSFVCSDFGKQFAEIAAGRREPAIGVGNIEARRDFTDVRDVVRAYWLLMETAPVDHMVFNVCSGQAVQIAQILAIFEELSGIKVRVVHEERRRRSYDVPLVVGSFERLRRATGWTPHIPLSQTLGDVFASWQRDIIPSP